MHHCVRQTARALLAACLLTVVGCPDGSVPQTPLPDGVNVAGLLPEHQALLRTTLAISGGALAETELTLSDDLASVSGTFDVQNVTTTRDETLTLTLYGRFSSSAPEVVLGRLQKAITLEPNVDVAIDFAGASFETCGAGRDGRCSLLFDANRNGAVNIDDLLERDRSGGRGIDPAPQAPYLTTSRDEVQFASGVRLGTFARQLVVLENFGENPITIDSATVVGGQGFTISILDPSGLSVATPGRALLAEDFRAGIQPGQEAFIAVSFAPVNSFITTGAMFVRVTDTVTHVEQTARVKLIANPEGELRPADPVYVEPDVDAVTTTVGSLPVVSFPNAQLHSGDSLIAEDALGSGLRRSGALLDIDIDGSVVAFPADAAFAVDVKPGERFATRIEGLVSDVDLAVVELVDGAITGLACSSCISTNAGTSPEAVEVKNESPGVRRFLVVLGRVEDEPVSAGISGGLEAAETVTFRCATTVNLGPEFDETQPLAPLSGPLEGGIPVVLKGTGFSERARVFVGAAEALDVAVETDADGKNTITFTLPAAAGTENPASIIVENPIEGGDGQAATLVEAFTYEPPAPVIDELSPDLASTRGGTAAINIAGRFFSSRHGPPQVSFGVGASAVVIDATVIDASNLSVVAPPHAGGDVAATVSVRVRNRLSPDVDGAAILGSASNGVAFRYVVPAGDPPTITGVSPATGSVDGGTTVIITGTDLRAGLEVFFAGRRASCQVPVAGTSVECLSPASDGAVAVDISVVNADGQSFKGTGIFSYEVPPPSIASIFPARGITDGGTLLIVDGGGFRPGARVVFVQGATERPATATTRVSGTTLLVTTPPGTAGNANVVVRNLDGQEIEAAFAYFAPDEATPPPSLATLNPAAGDASGGYPVVISGSGFIAPSVIFGSRSVEVSNFIDRDPPALDEVTVLAPVSPTGVAAVVNVQVLNEDGQSAATPFNFTFAAAAAARIDRVDPSTFVQGQSTSFTVFGARFDAGARVLLGGVQATVNQVSSTTIRATTSGQLSLGNLLLVVEQPDGTSVNAPITVLGAGQQGARVVSVSTRDLHARTGGDEVVLLGNGLDDPTLTVSLVPGPFGTIPGRGALSTPLVVAERTAGALVVRTPALPASQWHLEVLRGATPITAPSVTITSHDPDIFFVEGNSTETSIELLFFGNFLNGARLVDIVLRGSTDIPCEVQSASEFAIQCRLTALPPSEVLTPFLVYEADADGDGVIDAETLEVDSTTVGGEVISGGGGGGQCGNFTVDAGEGCDEGPAGGNGCDSGCQEFAEPDSRQTPRFVGGDSPGTLIEGDTDFFATSVTAAKPFFVRAARRDEICGPDFVLRVFDESDSEVTGFLTPGSDPQGCQTLSGELAPGQYVVELSVVARGGVGVLRYTVSFGGGVVPPPGCVGGSPNSVTEPGEDCDDGFPSSSCSSDCRELGEPDSIDLAPFLDGPSSIVRTLATGDVDFAFFTLGTTTDVSFVVTNRDAVDCLGNPLHLNIVDRRTSQTIVSAGSSPDGCAESGPIVLQPGDYALVVFADNPGIPVRYLVTVGGGGGGAVCGNGAIDPGEQCDESGSFIANCSPGCLEAGEDDSAGPSVFLGQSFSIGRTLTAGELDHVGFNVEQAGNYAINVGNRQGAACTGLAFVDVITPGSGNFQLPSNPDGCISTVQFFEPGTHQLRLFGDGVASLKYQVSSSLQGGGGGSICGNGVVEPGEQCDDGNGILGDGCSDCFIDGGFSCVGGGFGSCLLTGTPFVLASQNFGFETITEPVPGAQLRRGGGGPGVRFIEVPAFDGSPGNVSLRSADDPSRGVCVLTFNGPASLCVVAGLVGLETSLSSFTVLPAGSGFQGVAYRSAADPGAFLRHSNGDVFVQSNFQGQPPAVFDGDSAWARFALGASCGNGVVESGEQCDDGNGVFADGCSECVVDVGFTCGGQPSICTPIGTGACGNGVLDPAPPPLNAPIRTDLTFGLALFGGVGAGLAIDSAGTVFIVENNAGRVRVQPKIGSDFILPIGPATLVNGADIEIGPDGFLYIADSFGLNNGGGDQVLRVDPVTGASTAIITGFPDPTGLAFDDAGNLLVASFFNQQITRFSTAGANLGPFGGTLPVVPNDIERGPDGGIYVAGFDPGLAPQTIVFRMAPDGSTIDLFGDTQNSGIHDPHSLVFDGAGDLWVTYYNGGSLVRFGPGGGLPAAILPADIDAPGVDFANGLAVDRAGKLYVLANASVMFRVDDLATAFSEECDDGDGASGNGCSRTCEIEPGFVCFGQPSTCTLP